MYLKKLTIQKMHKNFFLIGLFIFASFFTVTTFVFASPPSTRFAPGETLNPTCGPTDTNCAVDQIYVNPTTLFYGIGTNAPTAKFQVAQETTGIGTVSNDAGGTTVTGVGTKFTNTFKVGDTITIPATTGQTVTISAIASDTSMTTDAITLANSGVAYTLVGGTRFSVLGNGNIGIGTTTPSQKLDVVGNINISSGSAYKYAGVNIVTADPSLSNYFFGDGGNLTMTGLYNIAQGESALFSNTTGSANLASGTEALFSNTTGSSNVAIGDSALYSNTSGGNNTAIGLSSLYSNASITRTCNPLEPGCFIGFSGDSNTANGANALYSNIIGDGNTANGKDALYSNTGTAINMDDSIFVTGSENTANGYKSLYLNTIGYYNTANGANALYTNSTGNNNVALGYSAGYNEIDSNAFYVNNVLQTTLANDKNYSLLYGTFSGTAGSLTGQKLTINGNLGIGTLVPAGILSVTPTQYSTGTASQSLTTITGVGTTFTSAMVGSQFVFADGTNAGTITAFGSTTSLTVSTSQTVASQAYNIAYTGLQVGSTGNVGIGITGTTIPLEVKGTGTGAIIAKFTDVNTTGCTLATGGTISCTSDVRMKKNIEDINYGLDTIMKLRPVVYNWNYEVDGSIKNLGFIAQEVETVVPKLVATDVEGMKSLNTTGVIPILTKALQELNLNINAVSGTLQLSSGQTISPATESFVTAFFNNVYTKVGAWLADVTNGIGDVFAGSFHAKDKICINNTCVTETELQTFLQNNTPPPTALISTPTPAPTTTTTPPPSGGGTPPPQGGESTTSSPPSGGGVPTVSGGGGSPAPDPAPTPTSTPAPAL
ncbi:MAG: tail fiber domain-containing protein [Candidatus Paceibacterota bacterium]|jgi:hypothetical protein